VRISFMDAQTARGQPPLINDGTDNPLGLNKPGFRYASAGPKTVDYAVQVTQRARIQDIYDEHDRAESQRYLGDTEGDVEGAVCTVRNQQYPKSQGAPGRIRDGICVPDPGYNRDSTDAQTVDARESAYAEYDRQQAERWRGAA
jgi:hypothetical protein